MPSCSMVDATGRNTSQQDCVVGFMNRSHAKLKSSFFRAFHQRCGSAEIAVPTGLEETKPAMCILYGFSVSRAFRNSSGCTVHITWPTQGYLSTPIRFVYHVSSDMMPFLSARESVDSVSSSTFS